jgi:hypothetical protein
VSELEKQAAVDQQTNPAVNLLAPQPEFIAQCGSIEASWRQRGNCRMPTSHVEHGNRRLLYALVLNVRRQLLIYPYGGARMTQAFVG